MTSLTRLAAALELSRPFRLPTDSSDDFSHCADESAMACAAVMTSTRPV
jgi:hypothetical protein